jgi:hypothetical protein
VRKVSINGKWVTSDVIKSTETLLSKLNIPIT